MTVRSQIAADLEEEILGGRLAPGRRLPSVRALARRLGVHRNTVSAAYRELAREGLVQARPGSGVYVRSLAAATDGPAGALRRLLVERAARTGTARDVVDGLRSWVEALERGRIAVVEEEPQLLALLTWEIRRLFPHADVRGVPLARARERPAALATRVPISRPGHLEALRRRLPPWQECLPLRARPPVDVEARIHALPVPATLAACSGSPLVLRRLRELAWRTHGEALGFLVVPPGDRDGPARAARLAELILADALAFRRLPASLRRRSVEVRLVDRRAVVELQTLIGAAGRRRREARVGSGAGAAASS